MKILFIVLGGLGALAAALGTALVLAGPGGPRTAPLPDITLRYDQPSPPPPEEAVALHSLAATLDALRVHTLLIDSVEIVLDPSPEDSRPEAVRLADPRPGSRLRFSFTLTLTDGNAIRSAQYAAERSANNTALDRSLARRLRAAMATYAEMKQAGRVGTTGTVLMNF